MDENTLKAQNNEQIDNDTPPVSVENSSGNIDDRNYEELDRAIALAQHDVYKQYLNELSYYPLVRPDEKLLAEKAGERVQFIKLTELTRTKGEDLLQKLSTVYHSAMALGCTLIVMVNVPKNNAPVNIYLGIRNNVVTDSDVDSKNKIQTSFTTLKKGLRAQFPGTTFEEKISEEQLFSTDPSFFGDPIKYISSVTCVAAIRDKQKTEEKKFIQGIEKFIDTMNGRPYTALFIAEPISPQQQAQMREGYQELYTTLSPFAKTNWSFSEENGTSVMQTLTQGTSDSITTGTSKTKGHTTHFGINVGGSVGSARNAPTGVARAGQAISGLSSMLGAVGGIVTATGAGAPIGIALGVVSSVLGVAGGAMSGGSISKSMGLYGGINAGIDNSTTTGEHEDHTKAEHTDTSNSEGKTRSSGRTIQTENTNKNIVQLLERIDDHLKRTAECEDYGAYNCGAYFLSANRADNLLAANTYRALMLGEGSAIESSAINIWSDEAITSVMKHYLSRFTHPVFALPLKENPEENDFVTYTPANIVSGLELPLHLGLPTRSVYGLPVTEYAEFGRNVSVKKEIQDKLPLGHIYHMGTKEAAPVDLCMSELPAHTFITGSTGSGKTNTVCKMLENFSAETHGDRKVKFLVVEPAKGEYKNYFGGKEDVFVYGTNPKLMPLLKINPFSFPTESIHVLEHLDRLVEIFNVCWPMYAAMPAVLKNAIEKSYEDCGWNLIESENMYGENLYPCFADVARNVKSIIDSSEYDNDNKGAYKGALVTRLQALTNGINGLIFTDDEIPVNKLFNENVIVDLSRVGSNETKSLIMGMLVLKLQEYRMATVEPDNKHLNHVTVLEEAHNLLKRTSTEQSSESANLLGKSVEMLANSIAEMRAYGEGFIIADQAPGLLDMSVIRNTNTKIVMRLPDLSDRELVGKAAGLNDEQIVEIGKFELGVAAVMQSGWLEPVLCKVDECKSKYPFTHKKEVKKIVDVDVKKMLEIATYLSKGTKIGQEILTKEIMPCLKDSGVSASVRVSIFKQLEHPTKEIRMTKLAPMMSALFPEVKKAVVSAYNSYPDAWEWTRNAEEALSADMQYELSDQVRRDIIQAIITQHIFIERGNQADIKRWAETGGLR